MTDRYKQFKIFWGDAHTNVHGKDVNFPALSRGRLKRIMSSAEQHLDFLAIAYYPFEWYYMKGFVIESRGDRRRFAADWKLVQEVVAKANKPGKFVTFLGYEWHGDRRRYGDHNVYYLDDDEPLDSSESLPELYRNVGKTEALVIPHHTGYQVGERGKDWSYFDECLSPFVEIYSSHGSSEGCDVPFPLDRNLAMSPRVSGGTVQDGLDKGYRFGIIASGDNHQDYPGVWGNGLMAVFAKELTRESLWEAFKNRRVYGVTGDRIQLHFSVNGHVMGDAFTSESPVEIEVEVAGSHAIDRIEIIKNGRTFHTYCHSACRRLTDDVEEPVRAKLRIICGWGPGSPYKFNEIKEKIWKGSLSLSEGEILHIEPCFTHFGQKLKQTSSTKCNFIFTTFPRTPLNPLLAQHHRSNFQGAVFEVKAPLRSLVRIQADSLTNEMLLEDALKTERVIGLRKEAEKTICDQFELRPEEVENPDIYWHNAWKMKICKAIAYEDYYARISLVDEQVQGDNYYYARVSQSNGQMAWSSPIWVTGTRNVW